MSAPAAAAAAATASTNRLGSTRPSLGYRTEPTAGPTSAGSSARVPSASKTSNGSPERAAARASASRPSCVSYTFRVPVRSKLVPSSSPSSACSSRLAIDSSRIAAAPSSEWREASAKRASHGSTAGRGRR